MNGLLENQTRKEESMFILAHEDPALLAVGCVIGAVVILCWVAYHEINKNHNK